MDVHQPRSVPADAPHWSPRLPAAPGFEHLVVETPGLLTHVAAIGSGEPVVLLHGFPQHWWQWREVAPLLAERYRVLCPDLRGAGWTTAATPEIARKSRLQDLLAVLDALGLDRVRLVGHDMGALTGIQLAYSHPGRVRAMVQLAVPPAFMTFGPRLLPAFAHLPRLVAHRPGQSLRWLFGPRYAARPMAPSTVDAYLRVQERREVDAAVHRLYRAMVLPEAVRLARGTYRRQRLEPPTLVAFGRLDEPYTEELVHRISGDPLRHADNLEFAFVDGAAHYVTDDAPEEVARLVLEWFERVG